MKKYDRYDRIIFPSSFLFLFAADKIILVFTSGEVTKKTTTFNNLISIR